MALIDPQFDQFLLNALRVLRGYLDDVVLVGGCANALYRYAPDAGTCLTRPMVTYDLDVATASSLPRRGESLSALLSQAGFAPDKEGRPTNKYQLAAGGNMTMEFLCPMTALSTKVKEQRPALVTLPADATAEALDYLDLLLLNPLRINLRNVPPLEVQKDFHVRVPNPVGYVMQKVLVRTRRASLQKRKKDSYYMYETALVFRAAGRIRREAQSLAGQFPTKWGKRFAQDAAALYGHENAEGVQDAVEVAQANRVELDKTMVFRTMSKLVAEIAEGLSSPLV